MKKERFILAIFAAMIAWGASWPCNKVMIEYMGAAELVFLRYLLTALAIGVILIVTTRKPIIDRFSLLIALVSAPVTGVFGYLVFFGVEFGAAGLGGAFINAVSPIVTYLLSVALFQRKAASLDFAALAIGFSGAALMMGVLEFEANAIFSKYNLIFIAAAFLWSVVTILSAKSRVNTMVFSFYLYIFAAIGAAFFIDFRAVDLSQTDAKFWSAAVFVGVVSTAFATTLFFLGSKKLGADRVSVFMFVTPASAIASSAILLDETLSVWELLGIALSIVSVYMLNRVGVFKPKVKKSRID
ncbi:MAG: DMT family transporter [Helicobacteraceae bacterium]|nr:DMT family transporter [Helicobacteraceae bacterium]